MKLLKRALSILLAVLLIASLFSTAFAAEDEDKSTYVLHYGVADDGYDGPNLQYFSPYVTDYAIDGALSYIQSNIFSLYNTVTKEVVPAYCTDIEVGAYTNRIYRRQNLEDSTYAATSASLLRAIVLNGFYIPPISGESTEDHAVRVAEKLQVLGDACGVEDLTIGEAISGTQTAIWRAAHGARLEFTDFVRTIYTTKVPSATKYYDLCNEERENGHIDYTVSAYGRVTLDADCDAWLCARIKAVYDYLLALEPIEASDLTVSASSFTRLSKPQHQLQSDGTYNVTVTTTVDVSMAPEDALTLTASLNNTYTASVPLSDGSQTVTLQLEDVPAELASEDVYLTIEGVQTASDVFLYDAYGEREAAQSMIGMDNSQMPVRARVLATSDRILSFRKTSPVATGDGNYELRPLEGITFDIYLAATLDDYLSGDVTLPDAANFPHDDLAQYTVITDADGRADLNLTRHNLPDGVYLVVEREHPAIVKPVDPFYVTIPTTNAEGTGHIYEVLVQPKNDVKGDVQVDKDINSIGNDSATVGPYETHSWIISASIPDDIAMGKSYIISDTLDNRLDYVGNLKVNVESEDGQTVLDTLIEGTDYTFDLTDADSLAEGAPCDSFAISLTAAGMAKIAELLGENSFNGYRLRVHFDAQINANAQMGSPIPNQALLHYTNSVNFEFDVESDEPTVETGAASLLKVDASNQDKPLSGAVFELYRKATADEVASGGGVTLIAGVSAPVVKVAFYDQPRLTGERVTSITTGDDGMAYFYGLAYGEYYLVETQSPNGYNLLSEAVTLTVDSTSHTYDRTVIVENYSGTILPSTGGMGTWLFTISGLALISIAVVLLLLRKRNGSAAY